MGCYETITFHCPDCGEDFYTQSKSGPCALLQYEHTSVVADVASDANRHAPFKCECGSEWEFAQPAVISLTLRKVN